MSKSLLKCVVCDTLIEVLEDNGVETLCCGRPMETVVEHPAATPDGDDPHTLRADVLSQAVRVTVGRRGHPMSPDHRIEWIEACRGSRSQRVYLQPGQLPVAEFITDNPHGLLLRAYCNAHGLFSLLLPDLKEAALAGLAAEK